ncbi:Ger(x)C family spore germination protein [Cytobacillus sp.]|uniref:Ger(x)C family spore germination protein n=1 Tax=Cytobacillus sp. TaxID=2675269 RepID=UPI0028BD82A8|nr:Ger(x)C family spore germination protein [Cytobacillus sp.]
MKNLFFILLFLMLLTTGCVPKSIIDDINIEAASAFDELEDDTFVGTVLIQEYLPDQSTENKTFTATAKLRRDLLLNIQRQSSEPLHLGGLMVTIFGDKLADRGIMDFVDNYQRDPSIGARNYLATSSGSALQILKGEYGPRGNSAYLNNLIEHNMKYRDLPETNLHIFIRDFYTQGKDPYLPELHQINNEKVEISGLSLFKKDREVHVLSTDKMFFFKLLADRHSNGSFKVDLGSGREAEIKSISSKHKIKISKKNPSQVVIHIKIKGVIPEYTGEQITPKIVKEVEKALEKKVNKECLGLVKQFQEQEIDPVGFGFFHRKQIRGYNFKRWEDDYKRLTFKIKTDVNIVETGVLE